MRWRACLAVVSVVLAAPLAHAQQSQADKLFDEGAALMKDNKYSEACPKFEQSNT